MVVKTSVEEKKEAIVAADEENDDAVDDWENADFDDIVEKLDKKEVIVVDINKEDINASE